MAKPAPHHAKRVAAMHDKAHAANKKHKNVTHVAGKKQPVYDSSEWNVLPDAKA